MDYAYTECKREYNNSFILHYESLFFPIGLSFSVEIFECLLPISSRFRFLRRYLVSNVPTGEVVNSYSCLFLELSFSYLWLKICRNISEEL